jgi:hypothetical protein
MGKAGNETPCSTEKETEVQTEEGKANCAAQVVKSKELAA